ncbi:MAG TPA: glycoside hydrolase family 38 C-terminal domain-containing protein [Candidatus Lokiarchaeia archaeon]|nr:glycoside hydrolase family 38 C-terminal domain-containing protein [Candidatus Lokiarchaeia archaeon]
MVLPKKTRVERFLEWSYRHHMIVSHIVRGSFRFRTKGSPFLVDWNKGIKLLSIGNSHIDAAWLWRKEDTRTKKINITFDRALLHMNMYPEFTFTQNQAVYYAWTKELHPDIWSGIKQRVKEGRWDIVGGDWVECDANIPCGESLIRQRVAGQRFFLEEFGFIADVAWADDVFGFPHSYPQILAKTGARYFYTNKFCYNEANKFPYHGMIWKSPDGSSVLAYWMQHKNSWGNWLRTFKELSVLVNEGDHVELTYMSDLEDAKQHFSDEPLNVIGNMYGEGDGGNGPKPMQIIEQLSWQQQGFSRLGTTKDLFSLLESYRHRLPVWNDELYLECHQGTLTSIHMIKENNQTAEVILHAIEYLNALGVLAGGKDHQPEINELWKTVLFNQFHDVLPGSSIIEVYRDAARDYQSLYNRLYEMRDEICGYFQDKFQVHDEGIANFVICNDLSWPRSGVVTVYLPTILHGTKTPVETLDFSVQDGDGTPYPCQVVNFPHHDANREFSAGLGTATGLDYMKTTDRMPELEQAIHPRDAMYMWILVPHEKPVDAFGSRAMNISWKWKENALGEPSKVLLSDTTNFITLENGEVSVCIDRSTARITEIGLANNVNCIKESGLVLYDDPATKFDAWNIDPRYHDHEIELPSVGTWTRDHAGPVVSSVLLETRPSASGTVYYHRIYLISGIPIVYHEIYVNWHEDHKLLKYKTVPAFDSDTVRCGMQFGSIIRDTLAKNRFTDYIAKYEYPTQQWNSVQGSIDGTPVHVALLNRNKHGLFCKGSTMELSLLKAARFEKWTGAATLDPDDPRPTLIDRGFHRLSMAIKIGTGDNQNAIEWRAGTEFNVPFSSVLGRETPLPQVVIVDNSIANVEIGTVKMLDQAPSGEYPPSEWLIPEDGACTWILLRLTEYSGLKTDMHVDFGTCLQLKACIETDMLERVADVESNVPVLDPSRNSVVIHLEPHEIKTIAVGLVKSP